MQARVWFANSLQLTETLDAGYAGVSEPDAVAIDTCVVHPQPAIGSGHDLGICFLKAPQNTPLDSLASDEDRRELAQGGDALLVGYGPDTPEPYSLTKAAVWAKIQDVGQELAIGDDVAGTCPGDSGGPAYASVRGELRLIGVLSSGAPSTCGMGWYTDVALNREWIEAELELEEPLATEQRAACSTAGLGRRERSLASCLWFGVGLVCCRRACGGVT